VTDDGSSGGPLWTPDGKRIVFTTVQANRSELKWTPVDGGSIERLVARPNAAYAQSWTPDGSALAFTDFQQQANTDIWIVPLNSDRHPVPILTSRFSESHAEFSPNGRWLAYVSNEAGRSEVFVRPYPAAGVGQPISTEGGNSPAWSRDGKELYYTTSRDPVASSK
jgi:Tol biopolymer transport system component